MEICSCQVLFTFFVRSVVCGAPSCSNPRQEVSPWSGTILQGSVQGERQSHADDAGPRNPRANRTAHQADNTAKVSLRQRMSRAPNAVVVPRSLLLNHCDMETTPAGAPNPWNQPFKAHNTTRPKAPRTNHENVDEGDMRTPNARNFLMFAWSARNH